MSLLCRGGSARLRRGSSAANGGAGEGRDAEEEVDEVNDEPVRPSWSSAGFSSEMTLLNQITSIINIPPCSPVMTWTSALTASPLEGRQV